MKAGRPKLSPEDPKWIQYGIIPRHLTFPFFFLVAGLTFMVSAACVVLSRARIDLNGTIVSREEGKDPGGPHRYYTKYLIQNAADGRTLGYIAAGVDNSLSRDLPQGARLVKRKWNLAYEVNGRSVHDFPVIAYSVQLLISLLLATTGLWLLRKRWKRNASYTSNAKPAD